ncbi:glycerophosphodiester phosphodiesterase GDPDL3-like [Dioscorea cayenensis subsp. rotundata]|uniref:glycerophosphodiester phosphodiesterase n=1 Tax=Dioscorea cayennensis subsp. rotundata TaxID=55577 RepID=A0AB40AU23_DIOCR|nr:glycerophosphodiester phosphodiesterase GDPDL3-like [Dioscorea cayenensis subsp. rotundata]
MQNCTDISRLYPQGHKVYSVNGVQTTGWFPVDYNAAQLVNVSLVQGIFSRTDKFDSVFPILGVEDVVTQFQPPGYWLNVQHDLFYTQHNLSMRSYVLSVSKSIIVDYISSPEVRFLSSIANRFNGSKTKLVFRFLGQNIQEPTTNQTYGSLLKNLTFIKTFASGILVPKNYIWPLTPDQYLQPHTSVVADAHKAKLEVYASEFANDGTIAYNYSYDPLVEYLNFVDNGDFSVDGVLTDFPITPAEAINCYSHLNKNSSGLAKPVIISHHGSSGIYPECTDLAYQQAVSDGSDFIDCPVQITQDGVLVCMGSINLMDDTTVTKSSFNTRLTTIPEIQTNPGIFTFNLTWEEIQTLKPMIENPEVTYLLYRNPRSANAGNFMTLSSFLSFTKDKKLSGVLIEIENAAFVAEKLGASVTDAVISALNDSGYSNQTTQQVIIRSSNSAVLVKLKQQTKYKLEYMVDESIRDADNASITDIKKFADSVSINKQSIFPKTAGFITTQTGVVKRLKSAGLAVNVYFLQNEFVSQAWDFFSDPYSEITNFVNVNGANVDGIITDFPATTNLYRRNACQNMGNNTPTYMLPVQVGPQGLIGLIKDPRAQPPALAPMPVLDAADVVEPPLPSAAVKPPASVTPPTSTPPPPPSGGNKCNVSFLLVSIFVIFGSVILI